MLGFKVGDPVWDMLTGESGTVEHGDRSPTSGARYAVRWANGALTCVEGGRLAPANAAVSRFRHGERVRVKKSARFGTVLCSAFIGTTITGYCVHLDGEELANIYPEGALEAVPMPRFAAGQLVMHAELGWGGEVQANAEVSGSDDLRDLWYAYRVRWDNGTVGLHAEKDLEPR